MAHKTLSQTEIQESIEYINKKIVLCTNDAAKQKYIKQKELLEDAIEIYELNHDFT
jgi:hypothetical protein